MVFGSAPIAGTATTLNAISSHAASDLLKSYSTVVPSPSGTTAAKPPPSRYAPASVVLVSLPFAPVSWVATIEYTLSRNGRNAQVSACGRKIWSAQRHEDAKDVHGGCTGLTIYSEIPPEPQPRRICRSPR